MNTKKSISDFYKHADLNDISKDVVKAFEIVVREDERKKVVNKLKNKFKKNITVISKRELINKLEEISNE